MGIGIRPYTHEPFSDFGESRTRRAFAEALQRETARLGRHCPLVIGGERIDTSGRLVSANPARREQVVGTAAKADAALADRAVEAAASAYAQWRHAPAEQRADLLFKAAALTRRRRHEFSALLVLETGKPWREADADTAEAIDFMEYYGREALRLADGAPVLSRPGEINRYRYLPLGVGIVLPPWNFAMAIMAGMTMAAVGAGNTVVLKPASNAPVIAARFVELLEEAGLPPGVVNYVPGSGAEVGDRLVDDPRTRFVSFTGSREVGLRIFERAAKVQPGQLWLKRVLAELGGKDAIVVDRSADLELAAQAIVASAFGYAGQKCSACSRAIVVADVYDEVLARTVKLAQQLTVGDPAQLGCEMGPLIDRAAYDKVMDYVALGHREGRLATGGEGDETIGWYAQPTIFADVQPQARLMQEEIFGPVLALCRAPDFDEALAIANDTAYGLTGAVISRDRDRLEQARREFHVGNLYLNRGCTGAIVGYQPFGGFNMSGTDAKAGGPDYLALFMQAQCVTEQL
ncbi:L-glutamate gamma-semialdehyde dehydrogenase [Paenibacillus sp. IB182496]|uniref:L-glutamate gamma-semialdehyde dehydrogenase n=1 Tax=Paenibacillus sabuli TaxID=2772509 RepID=A0A927BQM7_9BACL|nr:L-glutamate gamma-semialdehyde dehydrogenase [Paenibacillus sabuli]MBD2844962.1 L-glutamate gamma-semialdehyde dehydrogenase [Paenibacillus sabuli]